MSFRGAYLVGWVVLSVTLAGCVTSPRAPFTQAEQASAILPGFGQVRYAAEDESLAHMLRQLWRNSAGEAAARIGRPALI